jgi:hypothetical protein
VVLIYVDDLIITRNNIDSISYLKSTLQHRFSIKNPDHLKYFFGIEMMVSHKGLFLNQHKYVFDLLKDVEMMDAKPDPTPLDSKLKLETTNEPLRSINHYQHFMGKLIYLTIKWLNITYAISLVSQFMHAPIIFHLSIVKRIMCYLKGSIEYGIVMPNNVHIEITGYNYLD